MVSIVPRAEWGARYSAGFTSAPLPASEVWLHHSVTVAPDLVPPFDDEHRAMRTLEDIGQQRFGGGISYTFAIMPTGRIYEGHGVARQGAHTGGRNSIARAIVYVGNFDANRPTRAMIESTAALLVHGRDRGWWRSARLNGGHQQAPGASTACPGRYGMAVIGEINQLAASGLQGDDMSAEDVRQITEHVNIRVDELAQWVKGHTEAVTREIKASLGSPAPADLDALADKVADRIATRLKD